MIVAWVYRNIDLYRLSFRLASCLINLVILWFFVLSACMSAFNFNSVVASDFSVVVLAMWLGIETFLRTHLVLAEKHSH